MNVTVLSSTACPQTISEIARPNVCAHSGMSEVCLSPPSPIASLIRSAPQNGKQMDVAVGEKKRCVCQIVFLWLQSKDCRSSVCAITPLSQVQTGSGYSYQTGKHLCHFYSKQSCYVINNTTVDLCDGVYNILHRKYECI